jgi:hypothetical protein
MVVAYEACDFVVGGSSVKKKKQFMLYITVGTENSDENPSVKTINTIR